MVGRDVIFALDKKPGNPGNLVLDVKDVYAENDKGLPALRGLSLNVRAGEIVGVAGVAGNGKSGFPWVPVSVDAGLLSCPPASTNTGRVGLI